MAFRGADWLEVGFAIRRSNYAWLAAALLSVMVTLVLLTARWRLLFYPDQNRRSWLRYFNSIIIGQAVNIAVPGRWGEIARAYALKPDINLSKTQILVTVVTEKVIDLVMLALAVVILRFVMIQPVWASASGLLVLAGGAIALAGLITLSLAGRSCLTWLENVLPLLSKHWIGVMSHYGQLASSGFRAMRRWQSQFRIWGLSLCIWASSAATNYCLFQALDLKVPPIASLLLLVVLQVGNAPPSLPGKLGVSQYLTVLALSTFALQRNVAVSYAIALYVITILPKIIMAIALLSYREWRPSVRELRLSYDDTEQG